MDLSELAKLSANLEKLNRPLVPQGLTVPRVPVIPPLPDSVTNPAKWTRTRLMEYIEKFEANLDEEHEVCARLVSFGQSITFHIQAVGYYGPDIISFDGVTDLGEPVQLIQHISQLSVLLLAAQKLTEKANRIGFRAHEEPST